jgi:hypothetical protein
MHGLTALPRDYFSQINYSLTAPTLHISTALNHKKGPYLWRKKNLIITKMQLFFKPKQEQKEYQARLVK